MKLKVLIASTFFTLIILISGCGEKHKENRSIIKYVKTDTITPINEGDKLVFNGFIKEQSLTTLSFRVGGPIMKINVKTGDFIKKGEVIASIDKRDYQLQVNSSKAQYLQLKGEYERYKELFNIKKIPANTYEKIESGYLMAKTGYENAQNQLRDTELKAPFSGYIHMKMVETFQTVGPGMPIVSMIDISKLEVVIAIPENLLSKAKQSSRNFLSVQNSDISQLPLKKVSIGEKASKDGMYELKLNFENNPSYNIYPGMSAEVTMLCNKTAETIKIPATAIFHENDNDYIWLYSNSSQTVNKKIVCVEQLVDNGFAQISSGLNYGDVVVTAGVHYLHNNQQVKLLKKQSTSNVGGLL